MLLYSFSIVSFCNQHPIRNRSVTYFRVITDHWRIAGIGNELQTAVPLSSHQCTPRVRTLLLNVSNTWTCWYIPSSGSKSKLWYFVCVCVCTFSETLNLKSKCTWRSSILESRWSEHTFANVNIEPARCFPLGAFEPSKESQGRV